MQKKSKNVFFLFLFSLSNINEIVGYFETRATFCMYMHSVPDKCIRLLPMLHLLHFTVISALSYFIL